MPDTPAGLRRTGTHGNNVSFEYGTMPDTLYATTVRAIQDELTRLHEIGYTVSFDCEEGWLVATDRDGASSIIARLEEPHDA